MVDTIDAYWLYLFAQHLQYLHFGLGKHKIKSVLVYPQGYETAHRLVPKVGVANIILIFPTQSNL